MKMIVNGNDLSNAVMKVSKAISVKTTNPILEGIKLSVRGDNLTLTATDMEIGIEKTIACETFMEGDIVVPGKMFAELVKKLENENEVEFFLEEANRIKIVYGDSVVYLSSLSADEYPSLKKNLREKWINLSKKCYKDAVNKTVFACSTDESRPILKGCLFEVKGGDLKCVALDGFRMAVAKVPLISASGDFKMIIPSRALGEISRMLEEEEGEITIVSEDNSLMVEENNTVFVSRLLEGEFINYSQIIPTEFITEVTINRNALISGLERATVVAKDSRNLIKLEIREKFVNIKANSEKGNVNENVQIKCVGKDLDINFNSKYIVDALKASPDEYVNFKFVGEIAPAIITPFAGDDYVFLVLPIRINS